MIQHRERNELGAAQRPDEAPQRLAWQHRPVATTCRGLSCSCLSVIFFVCLGSYRHRRCCRPPNSVPSAMHVVKASRMIKLRRAGEVVRAKLPPSSNFVGGAWPLSRSCRNQFSRSK